MAFNSTCVIIGMYGGSFDPLHVGRIHDIIHAASICEELKYLFDKYGLEYESVGGDYLNRFDTSKN